MGSFTKAQMGISERKLDSPKEYLVVSFYYGDQYYYKKAAALKNNLDSLNIPYEIDELCIPHELSWIDATKQKIQFIAQKISEGSASRIIWVDVDCQFQYFPEIIKSFSADIIGFQRAFNHPANIGYSTKKRFWEPCLFGFQVNSAIREFFTYIGSRANTEEIPATDDYYFEEGWRKFCSELSFQVIPSSMRKKRDVLPEVLDRNMKGAFFVFGSSGNVSANISKAVQHDSPPIQYRGYDASAPWFSTIYSLAAYRVYEPAKRRLKSKALNVKGVLSAKAKSVLKIDAKPDAPKINKLTQYMSRDPDKDILLSWWPQPKNGNFGDFLSPYIVQRLSGRGVKYQTINDPKFLSIGSIAKFAKKGTDVWGSGVSRVNTELNPMARYLAVRGPLTRQLVIESGGTCPEIYGDPAILLPKVYKGSRNTGTGRIGLIRHTNHLKLRYKLPDYIEERDIRVNSAQDIEALIDWILSCDVLLSSAMHPHIVALAYGVPSRLITFEGWEDAIPGDGIKFEDFYLGVGLDAPEIPVVRDVHDFKSIAADGWVDSISEDIRSLLVEQFNKAV